MIAKLRDSTWLRRAVVALVLVIISALTYRIWSRHVSATRPMFNVAAEPELGAPDGWVMIPVVKDALGNLAFCDPCSNIIVVAVPPQPGVDLNPKIQASATETVFFPGTSKEFVVTNRQNVMTVVCPGRSRSEAVVPAGAAKRAWVAISKERVIDLRSRLDELVFGSRVETERR